MICGFGDRHSAIELLSCNLKTVTGVVPALAELQSAALPLGYTVIYHKASAERFELSLTASKTVVLPIRRNGNNAFDKDRTCDAGFFRPALYHLSYEGKVSAVRVELTFTVSETVVLPVRRNGNIW